MWSAVLPITIARLLTGRLRVRLGSVGEATTLTAAVGIITTKYNSKSRPCSLKFKLIRRVCSKGRAHHIAIRASKGKCIKLNLNRFYAFRFASSNNNNSYTHTQTFSHAYPQTDHNPHNDMQSLMGSSVGMPVSPHTIY